tara:strand:- start:48 stop:521 length:474 start_codon:yes stop_codon:yes gene_type:complete
MAKRLHILILLILVSFSSYGQKYDEWTFSPFFEVGYQGNLQLTPGIRYRQLTPLPHGAPIGAEIQLGSDLNFVKSNYFNLRFEASVHSIFILGFATQYWNTKQGPLWTIGPKTGITIHLIEFNYSYNIHLNKNNSIIGKNRFGLKLDIETLIDRIKK